MSVNQVSVFLENKPGTLNKMTEVLADGGINIRALSLADTKDFSTASLINRTTNDVAQVQHATMMMLSVMLFSPMMFIFSLVMMLSNYTLMNRRAKESEEALPMMSKCLAMFDDDYVTRDMFQKFIIDEQDHYNWVRRHLNLIKEIGYENYLIEQMDD